MSRKPNDPDKEGRLQSLEEDDFEENSLVGEPSSRNEKDTKWSLMRKLRRSSSHFTDSLRMMRIKEQEGNRRASLSPERVVVMRSSINRRQSTIGLVGKSTSVGSPARNGDGSPSPGGASSREVGGSSKEVAGFRSLDGTSSSDARSRERWRSMARRGSAAEGQSGSGAKRKSERKGSGSAGSSRPPRSNYWRLPGVQEDE